MADRTGKPWMAIGETDDPEAVIESFEAEAAVAKGDAVHLSGDGKVSSAVSAQDFIGVAVKNAVAGALSPETVIHWRLNSSNTSSLGLGLLQVLVHTLTVGSDKRPAYSWMKAKIERAMPKIFEKYAGPDVLAYLEKADPATIRQFESAIRNRPEEGAWLFYNNPCEVKPVTIDPRAQGFIYYIDHIVNQFYLGCETPLPRLFSTLGFTEASA